MYSGVSIGDRVQDQLWYDVVLMDADLDNRIELYLIAT